MTKLKDKNAVANQVLYTIQSQTPPGRFLEPTGTNGEYKLLDQASIMKKIKQALRETPKKRKTATSNNKTKKSAAPNEKDSGDDREEGSSRRRHGSTSADKASDDGDENDSKPRAK